MCILCDYQCKPKIVFILSKVRYHTWQLERPFFSLTNGQNFLLFCLRWHPTVYHFCPLFTSHCLDNKLCFSCSSHWPPQKIKDPLRSFSLFLRGHSVTQILLSSLLFSRITSVMSGGTHTLDWSVQHWAVSIRARKCELEVPDQSCWANLSSIHICVKIPQITHFSLVSIIGKFKMLLMICIHSS